MKTKASTMKTKARITLFGLVMVIGLCYANFANAESSFVTGGAAGSGGGGTSVNLDFQIVIPQFLFFRVGSANAFVNQIEFTPTGDEVANATAGIGATAASGDLGSGSVTVSIVSNATSAVDSVVITETNDFMTFGLTDGSGNWISYNQINTGSNNGLLPAPDLSDSSSNSVTIAPNVGNITNIQAQWTYTYDNPATIPVAGTYGGQVTYTAAIP
jgi:hypothetical protein